MDLTIEALVRQAQVALDDLQDTPLTDAGNAEAFARAHAGAVRYDHSRRAWLLWRPPVWRPDQDGEITRLFLDNLRERQRLAMDIPDDHRRREIVQHLLASESHYRVTSALNLARAIKPLAMSGQEFDRHPDLLVVTNGVINLTTGAFREGRPDDYLTQQAGMAYDPAARAPRWEAFIAEVFGGDPDLAAFVQRAVGYSLTGWTKEQVFFFLYGEGWNGKSTFLGTLRQALGDYAVNASFATFESATRPANGATPDLMALRGARLVTASESKSVAKLNEAVLKVMAGEDPITGRALYQDTQTYQPTFKVWLAANNLPRVDDITDGFWRKVILVPFTQSFKGRADKDLGRKLAGELSGILNWAIAGCLAWQREGLNPPQRCLDAVEAWRADNDPLHDFLTEACVFGPRCEVKVSDLFAAYEVFCQQRGVAQEVKAANWFSRLVQAHGIRKVNRKDGKVFVGVSIKGDAR